MLYRQTEDRQTMVAETRSFTQATATVFFLFNK